MDLWSLLARLGERKIALASVAAIALALGVLGWTTSSPAYSLTAGQALRTTEGTGEHAVTTSGTFELGIIGAMLVQNTQTASFPGATVTSSNAIVSPPTALPLVTTTVTADSPEAARAALEKSRQLNKDFLAQLLEGDKGRTGITITDLPYDEEPTVSSRPKIRSAGIGAVLGGFTGLTALVIWDTIARRRNQDEESARLPVSV